MKLLLLIPIIFLFACSTSQTDIGKIDTLNFPAPSPTTIKQGKATIDSVKTKHTALKRKKSTKKFGLAINTITLGTLNTTNGTVFFDGSKAALPFYDTIYVLAGTYPGGVTFANVNGTAAKPTVIINKSGQVNGSNGSDAGIDLSTCRYIHLTGTGVASIKYGFLGSGGGTASFDAHYGTSDCEIDHLECSGSLYAGLVFRTYPSTGCQWSITGGWAIYNMIIHDNYVHDVPGEGMYLGQSHYGNQDANGFSPVSANPLGGCSSGNESPVIGAKIYNNIVKNVGYDGIQMSGCISGCSISYNTIIGFGTGGTDGQDGGITWNPGSVGTVDHNWIQYTGSGVCMGIMYQGQGDTYITNNVIIGGGNGQVGLAMLRNTQANVKGSTHANIFVTNNTIAGFGTGYWWYGDNGFNNNCTFENNIITTAYSIGNGNISTLQKFTNLEVTPPQFVSATDFHLATGSPAIGKGTTVAYVTDDYAGAKRVVPYDIGAYISGAGGTPPPTNTPPTVTSLGDQTLASGATSCNLSATVTAGSSPIKLYSWTQTSGPNNAVFGSPTSLTSNVIGLINGSYTFKLTVTDNNNLTASITEIVIASGITVTPPPANTINVTVAPGSKTTVPTPTGTTSVIITATACAACPPATVQRTIAYINCIGAACTVKFSDSSTQNITLKSAKF